jgi:hypothetical protein
MLDGSLVDLGIVHLNIPHGNVSFKLASVRIRIGARLTRHLVTCSELSTFRISAVVVS